MSTKTENTGWNPSYTISSLLMQVQIFLANPDLSEKSMPKPYQIKELKKSYYISLIILLGKILIRKCISKIKNYQIISIISIILNTMKKLK